jgi:hemoglobin
MVAAMTADDNRLAAMQTCRPEVAAGARVEGSIFARYGGFVAIRRIVSAFYARMLQSPALAPHFAGVDMRRLIDHQTKFVTQVMGGPATFPDRQIERAHAGLGITAGEFAEMVGLLRATLEEAALAPVDVEQVLDEVRRREPLIVRRG